MHNLQTEVMKNNINNSLSEIKVIELEDGRLYLSNNVVNLTIKIVIGYLNALLYGVNLFSVNPC